jgi:hypothetical protein
MILTTLLLLRTIIYIGIYPSFIICRRNIGESTCGDFFSSTCFKFTKGSNIFPSSRIFSFTKDSITPCQTEAPVSLGMNPSSPQPETSNLPGTAPASPQLEVSALLGTPQAPPQLITHEIPLEPEQTSFPIQETRNEISVNTCTFISIQYIIPNSTILLLSKIRLHHHQALHLL